MRLWHNELIEKLPRQQLLGQWRECLALLGNGWGKKHRTVNYVFKYPVTMLIGFTFKVYNEMLRRGYNANKDLITVQLSKRLDNVEELLKNYSTDNYPEHNKFYMIECIYNLKEKNIDIV